MGEVFSLVCFFKRSSGEKFYVSPQYRVERGGQGKVLGDGRTWVIHSNNLDAQIKTKFAPKFGVKYRPPHGAIARTGAS